MSFLHIFAISQHFCYQKREVPTRMQTSKTSELPVCASSLRPGAAAGGDTERVGASQPEAVYVLAHFFAPFIPIAAEANCQFAAVGCEESET